jgi:hypothetical protein
VNFQAGDQIRVQYGPDGIGDGIVTRAWEGGVAVRVEFAQPGRPVPKVRYFEIELNPDFCEVDGAPVVPSGALADWEKPG